jgi:hypothetical protein
MLIPFHRDSLLTGKGTGNFVICNTISYRTPSSSRIHSVGVTGNNRLRANGNLSGAEQEKNFAAPVVSVVDLR